MSSVLWLVCQCAMCLVSSNMLPNFCTKHTWSLWNESVAWWNSCEGALSLFCSFVYSVRPNWHTSALWSLQWHLANKNIAPNSHNQCQIVISACPNCFVCHDGGVRKASWAPLVWAQSCHCKPRFLHSSNLSTCTEHTQPMVTRWPMCFKKTTNIANIASFATWLSRQWSECHSCCWECPHLCGNRTKSCGYQDLCMQSSMASMISWFSKPNLVVCSTWFSSIHCHLFRFQGLAHW